MRRITWRSDLVTTQPWPTEGSEPAELTIESWSARSSSERQSYASLVLSGGGRLWRAHASGNGAIDALLRAVDDALAPVLGPGVQLHTYEVHATGEGHETAAVVTVSIRQRDTASAPSYPGRATHENVLEASLGAYVDAINRFVAHREVDVAGAAPQPGSTERPDAEPEHEVRSRTKSDILGLYNR
jgi:LeuA allosteric (dimerisation) domain